MQREEIQRRLGARIRDLRKKRGWTQDEFADLSGLHRAQVGAFENGRMNITLASLHLVAQTLGVRILDLFKGVEREIKPNGPKRSPDALGHGHRYVGIQRCAGSRTIGVLFRQQAVVPKSYPDFVGPGIANSALGCANRVYRKQLIVVQYGYEDRIVRKGQHQGQRAGS